jgi:hypothetical protein
VQGADGRGQARNQYQARPRFCLLCSGGGLENGRLVGGGASATWAPFASNDLLESGERERERESAMLRVRPACQNDFSAASNNSREEPRVESVAGMRI